MPRTRAQTDADRPPVVAGAPADGVPTEPEELDLAMAADPQEDMLAAQMLGGNSSAGVELKGAVPTQHPAVPRVTKDMATAALASTGLAGRPAHGLPAQTYTPGFVADYSQLDDAEIMLRVRDGDVAGYEYLVQKYRRAIVNFMYRMVRNQAIGEELAQEVFLRVYRSRATYRAEARFTTWLYRIATNLGVNHARDNRLEASASNVYLDQADAETGTRPDVADSTPTIEADLVTNDRLRAIRACVEALPERQRNAVLMHKYQDLDYREIGRVLNLSESATKSLLFRAYQTLRESLKEFV